MVSEKNLEKRELLKNSVASFAPKAKRDFEKLLVAAYMNTVNKKGKSCPPSAMEDGKALFIELFDYPLTESDFYKNYQPLKFFEQYSLKFKFIVNLFKCSLQS